jgi:hypothetical protein
VAQEKLREAMARAQQIGANILATPQQVARRFFLVRRDVNRGEGTGRIEDGQLARVATVGLDAITGPPRN